MEKKFNYRFKTKEYYLPYTDENEYDYNDYDYTANDKELLDAVVDLVFDNYYKGKHELSLNIGYVVEVKRGLRAFIFNSDNLETLVDQYEDELKDYFEDFAYEEYKRGE